MKALLLLLAACCWHGARAQASSTAPQVLLAVTNSQSMDGNTSGAIMTFSGLLGGGTASLTGNFLGFSPSSYIVPPGFVPPLSPSSQPGNATRYSLPCTAGGSVLCDNGPSRLNLAKAAIQGVLGQYSRTLNFGLYTYSTGAPTLYTTWSYYMSPPGGFTFTNTGPLSATRVENPCYNFTSQSAAVSAACNSIATQLPANMASSQYMNIAIAGDDASVNDVFYGGSGYPPVMLEYGGTWPPTPYPPDQTLAAYNNGGITIAYGNCLPAGCFRAAGPTNAGYVPYTTQVMNVLRGQAYWAPQNASTGRVAVAMGTPAAGFSSALSPETNSASSGEVKALAGQSPIGGLMTGALAYLQGLQKASCQKQYVVLLTDGLPTLDLNGRNWPPLGSVSAAPDAYNVWANFAATGALLSTNDQALTDTIAAITNLANAGIKVYVIGLGAGVDATLNPQASSTLQAMAIAGKSKGYFAATDAVSLNSAFQAIAFEIYTETTVSAPVAPISVANGTSFAYSLYSDPSPTAGYVGAFSVSSAGVVATSHSWEGGALMATAQSHTGDRLYSTGTDNKVQTLAWMQAHDAAAFKLPATPPACVPDAATVVAYTANPSYSFTPSGSANACNYLGSRKANWPVGSFSSQNSGLYVGLPSNPSLISVGGYTDFAAQAASTSAGRPPMLMFTNNDGFLYALNAGTGSLMWGWMPRSLVGGLQNYASFQASQGMNGNFKVVDSLTPSGDWASFVVGSAQSGAEHYVLQLGANGYPTQVTTDAVVNGSAPGDAAGTAGTTPLRQLPQTFYFNGNAWYAYIVLSGPPSAPVATLYEVSVASGATSSGVITGFTPSSTIFIDAQSRQLWIGSATGRVYAGTLTGVASVDAANLRLMATVTDPASNSGTLAPLLTVGFTNVKGYPYVFAQGSNSVTVFGIGSSGWTPVWASTTTGGYAYDPASGLYSPSASVSALPAGSVITDLLRLDGTTMTVPVYVPPTDNCGNGTAGLVFFNMTSGLFSSVPYTYKGKPVTQYLVVGNGPAFTPTATQTNQGVALNPGSRNCVGTSCSNATLNRNGKSGAGITAWRSQ